MIKRTHSVLAQLKILETSRTRLESAVIAAEARAYQESAEPKPAVPINMFAGKSLPREEIIMASFVLLLLIMIPVLCLNIQKSHPR